MARFEEFNQAVLIHIPRATGRERKDIAQELSDHLADRRDLYISFGLPQEEAEKRAVAQMGDPREIGAAWNRQLSVFWHGVELACKWCLAALMMLFLIRGMSYLADVSAGIAIRQAGTSEAAAAFLRISPPLREVVQSVEQDIDLDAGRHIFRIYRTELIQAGEREALGVYLMTYPKNPFHQAFETNHLVMTCSGREENACNGLDFQVHHRVLACFYYLEEGEDTVTLKLELPNRSFTVELDLNTLEVTA